MPKNNNVQTWVHNCYTYMFYLLVIYAYLALQQTANCR